MDGQNLFISAHDTLKIKNKQISFSNKDKR